MFATNRRVLAGAGEAVRRFLGSGITELGPKLGPIVWQFAPTKHFEADDFAAFLELLPPRVGSVPLRHALDVRHESFRCHEYLTLARRHRMATVFTDSDDYPMIGEVTGGFIYARLMHANAKWDARLQVAGFDQLADCARAWRDGSEPAGIPRIEPLPPPAPPRDVFIYFINGAKEKAPAAAIALRKRLG